jgi:general secretion pathway protein H
MTSRSDATAERRSRAGSRGAAAGFTLIEMIVVLAIVGLVLSLVAVNRTPVSAATESRAVARDVYEALRAARSEALVTNRDVSFTVDVAHRSYGWGQRPPRYVPDGLQLALYTSSGDIVGKGAGRIRFDPDGGASGGRVTVAGGDHVWWIGVDWISGHVSIAEKTR